LGCFKKSFYTVIRVNEGRGQAWVGAGIEAPVTAIIAKSLGVSSSIAATLVTVTQFGYALGIFLLVPLGDVLNRRRLIPMILGLSAVKLC